MTGDRSEQGSDVDSDAIEGPSFARGGGSSDDTTDENRHVYYLDPDEPPCVGVVSAVAAVTGRETRSLTPLYDILDPDTLDRLVAGRESAPGVDRVTITFEYVGCTVTVDAPDRVVVAE